MKRTPLTRKTQLKAKPKLRKGTIHKAINPDTGRIVTVKGMKGRAWKAFAAYIRARDPYCITCGSHTTEAGHFLHNSDKENKQLGGNLLWYHETNVNGQCGVCNRHNGGRGAIYGVRLVEKFGDGILADLYLAFRTEKKWSIPELFEIEKTYQAKLESLQRGDKSEPEVERVKGIEPSS